MKNILKFGEFIKENLLLEGREHSFADKVVRAAQPLLSDDEQESDNLYEKILSWAISYYDNNIFGRNATDEDTINCLNSIKPKIEEWRIKQKSTPKGKKKLDDDDDIDEDF